MFQQRSDDRRVRHEQQRPKDFLGRLFITHEQLEQLRGKRSPFERQDCHADTRQIFLVVRLRVDLDQRAHLVRMLLHDLQGSHPCGYIQPEGVFQLVSDLFWGQFVSGIIQLLSPPRAVIVTRRREALTFENVHSIRAEYSCDEAYNVESRTFSAVYRLTLFVRANSAVARTKDCGDTK